MNSISFCKKVFQSWHIKVIAVIISGLCLSCWTGFSDFSVSEHIFNINLGRGITILTSKLFQCFKAFETSSLWVEWMPNSLQSSPGPYRAVPNLLWQCYIFPSPRLSTHIFNPLSISRMCAWASCPRLFVPCHSFTHPFFVSFPTQPYLQKYFQGQIKSHFPQSCNWNDSLFFGSATTLFGICFSSIYHRQPFYVVVYFSLSWLNFDSSPIYIYLTWNRQ